MTCVWNFTKYTSEKCKYISTCVLFNTDIELIRNFQRGLSFYFNCPCGAVMWSGCDISAIASAKNTKQNKIFWVAISRVKSLACWGTLCVSLYN